MLSRIAILSLTAATLAGCEFTPTLPAAEQTVFRAVGVSVPLSAGESRVYNGSYQGTLRTVVNKSPLCPVEPGERVLMVGDGVLWYTYSPSVFFAAPVQYDGTIDDKSGDMVLHGRIEGDRLRATIESPVCKTEISMHYVLNHGR